MIRKSVPRFSEKIMLNSKKAVEADPGLMLPNPA